MEKDELREKWRKVEELTKERFGEILDVQDIVFIIGLQELGLPLKKTTKQQKVEIMHIGICALLSPYGYYEFVGKDDEGWPHFENVKKLPALRPLEQEKLMKQAIIDYFGL
jgi:hypothetical protein